MSAQAHPGRLLIVVDDGWRCERRELLKAMKSRVAFDIATHDPETEAYLKGDFHVERIPVYPLKGRPVYTLVMFFARELDTQVVRTMNEIRRHLAPPFRRCLMTLRSVAGRIGLRQYTYHQALAFLYRRSNRYGRLLRKYDTIMFTPVNVLDKRLLYEARNAGLQLICSVYSWDNPMKDNEFPPDADCYLVWNEPSRDEIVRLHAVPPERIRLVGPTQFEFLLKRRPVPVAKDPASRYVLFACSVGVYPFLIEQEIRLIRLTRKLLDSIASPVTLVVRPYPFAALEDPYASLRGTPGIVVADFGQFSGWKLEVSDRDLEEKIRQIERAECLINVGSTIALEASFTQTPILQIGFNTPNDFAPWQDLRRILDNDHLRFIILPEYPNTVTSEEACECALRDILTGRAKPYRGYSKRLQAFARPLHAASYHELFIAAVNERLGGGRARAFQSKRKKRHCASGCMRRARGL